MLIPSDTFSALERSFLGLGGADAASAALALLTDSATRLRPTGSSDGAGGTATSWSSAGPFACFVAPVRTSREQQKAGTVQAVSYWKISFPADTDVLPKDRITVNGSTFEATGTDAGASDRFLLQVDAVRVT